LDQLGWIYGRNKKGYVDGHEREDFVQYRQEVFCPRMKVRPKYFKSHNASKFTVIGGFQDPS